MTSGSPHLLGKVSRLLDHLAAHGPSTATELASGVQEPRSSMYRILRNLDELGWVSAGPDGRWTMGPALVRWSAVAEDESWVARARPHLERLNVTTEHTVYLCTRRDLAAVCVDRLDGLKVADLTLQVGGALPLHTGATALALLAFAPDSVRERWRRLAADGLEATTPYSLTDVGAVESLLDDVRASGRAVSDRDVTLGIASVAAPVLDPSGRATAAVGVSGPREIVIGDVERLAALVTEVAAHLAAP